MVLSDQYWDCFGYKKIEGVARSERLTSQEDDCQIIRILTGLASDRRNIDYFLLHFFLFKDIPELTKVTKKNQILRKKTLLAIIV